MKTLIQSKPTQIFADRFWPQNNPRSIGVIDLRNEYIEEGWGIQTDDGFKVVTPGDWVVTGLNGERIVVPALAFRYSFDWILEIDFFRRYSDGHVHWIISGLDKPRRLPDWDSFIFRPQQLEANGEDIAGVPLYTVTMTYEAGVANAGQSHVCASCGLVDSEKFHRNVQDCLDAALKRIKELEGEVAE